MWIERDIFNLLARTDRLPYRFLLGVRQCGKTALLDHALSSQWERVYFDDRQLRHLARTDPGLFLNEHPFPLLIDEIQYAPDLFPELKLRLDRLRRQRSEDDQPLPAVLLWATGSNRIELEGHIQESLAGRVSLYVMHTCSVREMTRQEPERKISTMMYRGGWPELLVNSELDPVSYLDDYLQTFVERDVVRAAGISKADAFMRSLQLLAARTAALVSLTDVAKGVGVTPTTLSDWLTVLERALLIRRLEPWHSNANKRLTKLPKMYFLDTGLAARLQGWRAPEPMLNSPQAGGLFETLVYGELVRCQDHAQASFTIYFWRTKEGEEVDFVLRDAHGKTLLIEAKLGLQSISRVAVPPGARKEFGAEVAMIVAAAGGTQRSLSATCTQVPLQLLADFVETFFATSNI